MDWHWNVTEPPSSDSFNWNSPLDRPVLSGAKWHPWGLSVSRPQAPSAERAIRCSHTLTSKAFQKGSLRSRLSLWHNRNQRWCDCYKMTPRCPCSIASSDSRPNNGIWDNYKSNSALWNTHWIPVYVYMCPSTKIENQILCMLVRFFVFGKYTVCVHYERVSVCCVCMFSFPAEGQTVLWSIHWRLRSCIGWVGQALAPGFPGGPCLNLPLTSPSLPPPGVTSWLWLL